MSRADRSRWLRPVPALHIIAGFMMMLGGCTGEIGLSLPATGAGGSGTAGTGVSTMGMGGATVSSCAQSVSPGRAPLRRLTRFEYNNTVRDLFGDTTSPATALPPEELGNGFGNDADALSVPGLLAEQYGLVAEGIASRATATPTALGKLAPCAATVTATTPVATEDACVHTIINNLAPRAYRRALAAGESDALFTLEKSLRATAGATFATGTSGVIQALLQSPEFLYRPEWGTPDAAKPTLRRPTGDEMATRLSFMMWGTMPDEPLRAAAQSGELLTNGGVFAQATRLLADPRSHAVIRFFFDNLLPINGLSDLARDTTLFPTFSSAIGAAMREETQQFLEYEIFQGGGTWPSAITAPYTFVNDALATFYGIPGITGANFRKVALPDPTKRLGLLLQAGVMTGTITTNKSNPVLRGSFVVNKLLCRKISLPTDPAILAMVQIPADTSGATARERFAKHSAQAICSGCHQYLDPIGFALENFDPVGQYRTQENGVDIDVSSTVPGIGPVSGPIELVQKIAASEEAQNCFASHWLDFGFGRTMDDGDQCTRLTVDDAFKSSGYNVKQLLLALTQTDAFLYLPVQ